MQWNHKHAVALQSVFEALDEQNIPWMIMRNYERLPEVNTSKDIDIAIPRKDWKKSRELIYQVLKNQGFTHVMFTKFQSILCHTFYCFENDEIIALKIDIFACYEWRGAEYISFEKLYDRSRIYNGMHVPDEIMDGVMLFLKPLLLGGAIKEKYKQTYMECVSKHEQEFREVLSEIVGARESEELAALVKNGDDESIKKHQKAVRKRLWTRYFVRKPVRTIQKLIEHYYTEMRRRIFTFQNPVFAVLGSDGVGKTTFLNNWIELLVEHVPFERSNIEVIHFRPNIFPNLKKLLSGKDYDEKQENFTAPHRAKPAGKLSSFLRLTYYWLDYIIGVPAKKRKARLKEKYVIFDRYFHDFLVDPHRSRIELPYGLRKAFYTLVYKPKITFVLLAAPEVIYTRKQELELDEIKRQYSCYKSLINNTNVLELNAGNAPEKVAKEAFIKFIYKMGREL